MVIPSLSDSKVDEGVLDRTMGHGAPASRFLQIYRNMGGCLCNVQRGLWLRYILLINKSVGCYVGPMPVYRGRIRIAAERSKHARVGLCSLLLTLSYASSYKTGFSFSSEFSCDSASIPMGGHDGNDSKFLLARSCQMFVNEFTGSGVQGLRGRWTTYSVQHTPTQHVAACNYSRNNISRGI